MIIKRFVFQYSALSKPLLSLLIHLPPLTSHTLPRCNCLFTPQKECTSSLDESPSVIAQTYTLGLDSCEV